MKTCNKCNVEKSIDEFPKEARAKGGHRNACKECRNIHHNAWRTNNLERERNKGAILSMEFRKTPKGIEYTRNYNKQYLEDNAEILSEKGKTYRKNNAHIICARNAARRVRVISSTPSWANLESILEIYKERDRISLITGIPHHVDHIIPLCGKNVSGLHVENNLRIIPASENISKGNRYKVE